MDTQKDRSEAIELLSSTLEEWREGADDGAGPLSVDRRSISRIWITYGGPTAFIDYCHNTGSAELYSTYGSGPVTIELSPDEVSELEGVVYLEGVSDNA